MRDTVIFNGLIIQGDRSFIGSIEIEDGKIAAVIPGAGKSQSDAKSFIDAEGFLVFPGMIDTHVHIRGAELSHREDFYSGTCAAAAGGVTLIIEMPISKPPASKKEDFLKRVEEIKSSACVDFAMYGGAGADNLDEIEGLAKAGAAGFKTFLMPPVPGREAEFFGLCCETPKLLDAAMEKVQKTGLNLAVHSEINELVFAETTRIINEGRNGLVAFCESRPMQAETEGVKWVIAAAKKTGCRVSICHCSAPESIELIEKARDEGLDIFAETCPQYIFFDMETAAPADVFARIKPPYRDKKSMLKLREMYRNGLIDMTGSDHAPYLPQEKLKNGHDIWHTFDGVPGLEMSLPLLLELVSRGDLTYENIARNTAERPAKIFRFGDKGRIAVGYDADLVLVKKLDSPIKAQSLQMFTKSKGSAVMYDGIELNHRIEMTIVRGSKVFSSGEITGKAGYGKMVVPDK